MRCEEFEAIGLERDAVLSAAQAAQRDAAMQHADTCSRCASLQESWQQARLELAALRTETLEAQTPQRVEMRLRQEFRTRHHAGKVRAMAMFGAWALATAAVLAVTVSWWNWRVQQRQVAVQPASGSIANLPAAVTPLQTLQESAALADGDSADFTLLPGSLPQETDGAAIVRVLLQRGALGAFGLPVNEERVNEWIQVDLLVGEDGHPEGVRLSR
jgi:hypothetical protein